MTQKINNTFHSNKGVTLPELLVATLILVSIYAGMIICYIKGLELYELTRNSSIALNGVKNHMIAIENTPYDQITATFHNTTFLINGLNGIGTVNVNTTVAKILTITVNFCWQEKNGRVLGEDLNLDGQRTTEEDINNNNILDSPVEMITGIFDRT